jgi:hypothetical protein
MTQHAREPQPSPHRIGAAGCLAGELAAALRAEDSGVRREAARALGAIGELARPTAPAVRQALTDSDEHVREAAATALEKILPRESIERRRRCAVPDPQGLTLSQVWQKVMRKANVSTTMDDYANVDETAVEAGQGPQRNSLRHTPARSGDELATQNDAKSVMDSACVIVPD